MDYWRLIDFAALLLLAGGMIGFAFFRKQIIAARRWSERRDVLRSWPMGRSAAVPIRCMKSFARHQLRR